VKDAVASLGSRAAVYQDTEKLLHDIVSTAKPEDHILVMSNGGFDNLHERLLAKL
jgi:UDP-N-acetylmuramate: L-alanyl-gamma-D-glutamyl-meso-diaminopimelate ligase